MKNICPNDELIDIDLTSYEYLWKYVKIKDFTNFLKDMEEFVHQHKNLQKFADTYRTCRTANALYQYHSHKCKKEELEQIKRIIKEQFDNDKHFEIIWGDRFNEEVFWQLPGTNGLRVFGTVKGNRFTAMIFDYYHLVHPDKNYNDTNAFKNTYTTYYKESE